jgi:hypothetical protein
LTDDLTGARQPGQQSHQGRLNRKDDSAGARGDLRDITAELQRVAKTLVGEQQNSAIANRLVIPRWHRTKKAQLGHTFAFRLPACLELFPPFLELAGQQQREAEGGVPSRAFRSQAQCRAIARLGFVEAAEIIENVAEMEMCERMLGFEAQRRPYARFGFLEAPEVVEHASQFGVCAGKVRLQPQRLA